MSLKRIRPRELQTYLQTKEKVETYMKDMGYRKDEWSTYDRIGDIVHVVTEDGNYFPINVADCTVW